MLYYRFRHYINNLLLLFTIYITIYINFSTFSIFIIYYLIFLFIIINSTHIPFFIFIIIILLTNHN